MNVTVTVADVRSLMVWGDSDLRGDVLRMSCDEVYEVVDFDVDKNTLELREWAPSRSATG